MNKDLEMKLVKTYPRLYSQYGGDPRETCMAWGFECGDGWYDIINELSEKLSYYNVVAAQVKEKFGGLRFYLEVYPSNKWEEILDIIGDAEIKSFETCEYCGKPGKPTKGGWIKTLCKECKENDNG